MWIEGVSIVITGPRHPVGGGLHTRMALFTTGLFASLALAVAPFVQPPTALAWDHDYYDFCTKNLRQPPRVCCNNSGGDWSEDGDCTDPAAPPTPVPTVTQQVLPPVVVRPAP
jgi:hypothetical protein